MTGPTLSPDGHYRWDGRQWVPNGGLPPVPRRPRRWPWVVAVLSALFVGSCSLAAATANRNRPAAAATARPSAPPAAPPRDGSCAPRPCANDNYGWIVTASRFRWDAPAGNGVQRPEPGNVYVTVDVTFTNQLANEQHAGPTQFVLQDGAGVKHTMKWLSSCPLWDAVNLTRGATYGPRCLAFEATANRPAGLTLVWTPHLAGGDYALKLS